MTPEMWLDLEPIPHRASRNLPQIARIPRGSARCCLAACLARHLTFYLRCVPPTFLWSCATVGWVGAQHFLHAVVQACRVERRSGRPGPDESDLLHVVTKRLGAALHIVLVRALLGLIGHTTDS